MITTIRQAVLRANALFLFAGSLGGLSMDIRGAFLGLGPQGVVLANAPHAAIGFIEAHGLALIFAVLLWRCPPTRAWHATAMAIETLLGTANLVFWQIFVVGGALWVGHVTTSFHWLFVVLNLAAILALSRWRAVPSP